MLRFGVFVFAAIVCLCASQNAVVEFNLNQVPKYYTPINDDIYLAGTFNNWSPADPRFKFEKVTHDTYKAVVSLPLGSYQYKVTRGSWDTVETQVDGTALPNRNLQIIAGLQSLRISVGNWEDCKGQHSAVGNVNILDRRFPYRQFNTTKRIFIYLPSDYFTAITKSYPVIYMHDGHNLFDSATSTFGGEWRVDETMEAYYAQGKATAIVVGAETTAPNRDNELTPYPHPTRGGGKADLYLDFILNDLKPYIDSHFRTKPEREHTTMIGSSNGGLCAFYMGVKSQATFSRVGVFSPSFWYSNTIFDFALNATDQYGDLKMYFYTGAKETNYPTIVSDMLNMLNVLSLRGFKNLKSSINGNGLHHEDFWAEEFQRAYEWLWQL